MSISEKEVEYIANLARLSFDDKEITKLAHDLSNIVNFANTLEDVDVSSVGATAHILDIKNVFRKDEMEKSYDREEVLKNAPEKESGCISVPKTVE